MNKSELLGGETKTDNKYEENKTIAKHTEGKTVERLEVGKEDADIKTTLEAKTVALPQDE